METIRREKRHGRRLAPEDVYWLRAAALTAAPHDLLAAKFGSSSQSTATRAINGDTYAEVPHPVLVPPTGDPRLHEPRRQ
jgi:hypothetical protein